MVGVCTVALKVKSQSQERFKATLRIFHSINVIDCQRVVLLVTNTSLKRVFTRSGTSARLHGDISGSHTYILFLLLYFNNLLEKKCIFFIEIMLMSELCYSCDIATYDLEFSAEWL